MGRGNQPLEERAGFAIGIRAPAHPEGVEDVAPGHPQHVTVLSTLATVTFEAGKLEGAADLNRRRIALLVQAPGKEALLGAVCQNQVVARRELGRDEDADELEARRMTLLGRGLPRS